MRNRSLLLLILPFLIFAGNGWGATYYVKNSGNDGAAGTSDGTAWRTISKVNRTSFSPGDSILFNRGDTWQEGLVVPSSGSSGMPITFGAYGTGAKPKFPGRGAVPGWNISGNWTNAGSNIWYKTHTATTPQRLWLSGSEAGIVQSYPPNATYRWWWDSGNQRIYVYSATNPATAFSSMETGVVNFALYVDGKSYITFQNLDIGGSADYTAKIEGPTNGIIIEYCVLTKDSGCGIIIENGQNNNGIIRYNTLDTGDRVQHNFERGTPGDIIRIAGGANNWEIYQNTFIDCGHSAIEVSGWLTPISNILIHHNTMTSPDVDYCRGIGVEDPAGIASGVKVYNNLFKNNTVRIQLNSPGVEFYYNIVDGTRGTVSRQYAGEGVAFISYISGGAPVSATNMKIYNNVFSNNAEPGLWMYNGAGGPEQSGNIIKNNIFYNNGLNSEMGMNGVQFLVSNSQSNIINNTIMNNIFYKSGVASPVVYKSSGAVSVSNFNNSDVNGDIISGNIGADPLFVSSTDFHLQAGSPAIDVGIDVGLTSDYAGTTVPLGAAPDIGAYEYTSLYTSLTKKIPSSPSEIKISP